MTRHNTLATMSRDLDFVAPSCTDMYFSYYVPWFPIVLGRDGAPAEGWVRFRARNGQGKE
jgi:hypothetical protein